MELRPFNVRNHRVKRVHLSVATTGSTGVSAPGTGLLLVPVYFWAVASAVASLAILNGTTASTATVLWAGKTAAGVPLMGEFWEDTHKPNTALSLESTLNGGGILDFHVWYVVRRVGAGDAGATL